MVRGFLLLLGSGKLAHTHITITIVIYLMEVTWFSNNQTLIDIAEGLGGT